MIYLLTNNFNNNERKRPIIKSTKIYKYLVHNKIRLIPTQTKTNMIEVQKNIDNISTTDENHSQKNLQLTNM